MILFNPAREFLLKAAPYAKEIKKQELNQIEAEVMIIEENFFKIQHKFPPEVLTAFENKIYNLKRIIKNKKQEL